MDIGGIHAGPVTCTVKLHIIFHFNPNPPGSIFFCTFSASSYIIETLDGKSFSKTTHIYWLSNFLATSENVNFHTFSPNTLLLIC